MKVVPSDVRDQIKNSDFQTGHFDGLMVDGDQPIGRVIDDDLIGRCPRVDAGFGQDEE